MKRQPSCRRINLGHARFFLLCAKGGGSEAQGDEIKKVDREGIKLNNNNPEEEIPSAGYPAERGKS